MSDYAISRDQALRIEARMRDLETRTQNLVVGVVSGTLRRTELLNQLSINLPSDEARDVTGLTGRLDVGTIVLDWDAVTDPKLAIYEVQWSIAADFDNPTSRHTSNTFYTITGLALLTPYFARVRARVGEELGRWSPPYSSEVGTASWEHIEERSVTNLVRVTYGNRELDVASWFPAKRFSLTRPLDVAIAEAKAGPSFARDDPLVVYNTTRYSEVPPLPRTFDLTGDGDGGCIVGPFEIDTIGGFVEMSCAIGVFQDCTHQSGVRLHIIRDGEIIRDGWDSGSPDVGYVNAIGLNRGTNQVACFSTILDAPSVGTHIYELAFEPFIVGGAWVPGPTCIIFVKYIDMQLLELRR